MRIFFSLIITFILNTSLAQNITCDQVQNLRKKSLADVESFLTAKGWEMTNTEAATSEMMGKATFGYKVDQFDSEKAVSWITFYESSLGNNYNRLSIQVNKTSIYTVYLNRLIATGFKLKSSKITDDGIEKIYQNSTTTCEVTTTTTEGMYTKQTAYQFFFQDNLTYKIRSAED